MRFRQQSIIIFLPLHTVNITTRLNRITLRPFLQPLETALLVLVLCSSPRTVLALSIDNTAHLSHYI